MRLLRLEPLRLIAGAAAILASAGLAGPAGAGEPARTPHQEAMLALSDIDAAIATLNTASSVTASRGGPYKQQAHLATNAIVGVGASDYDASAGAPRDRVGALNHLLWLSAHAGKHVWGPAIQGALVNLQVAETHLAQSVQTHGLEHFWLETSDALQSLLIASGRPSQLGVLGGLRGALATTDLGVPPGGKVVSGCMAPSQVPAYGVIKGYLTYLAIPSGEGTTRLPETIGFRDISVHGNAIVMHTAAADLMGKLCPRAGTAGDANVPDPPGDVAALYTSQQAKQGKQVFEKNCASCHGSNLQGISAPPIGGATFLNKTKLLDWKVSDMRHVVVSSMPADNPGSLSEKQYAQVLAYLLAVNCYPAGNKPFPTAGTPVLEQTKLHPIQGAKGESSNKTCPVT
ncbi:MAG: c-type cytochrome [Bradyrhizobium sp.]